MVFAGCRRATTRRLWQDRRELQTSRDLRDQSTFHSRASGNRGFGERILHSVHNDGETSFGSCCRYLYPLRGRRKVRGFRFFFLSLRNSRSLADSRSKEFDCTRTPSRHGKDVRVAFFDGSSRQGPPSTKGQKQ